MALTLLAFVHLSPPCEIGHTRKNNMLTGCGPAVGFAKTVATQIAILTIFDSILMNHRLERTWNANTFILRSHARRIGRKENVHVASYLL